MSNESGALVDERKVTGESDEQSRHVTDNGQRVAGSPERNEGKMLDSPTQRNHEVDLFEQFKEFFRRNSPNESHARSCSSIRSNGPLFFGEPDPVKLEMREPIKLTRCLPKDEAVGSTDEAEFQDTRASTSTGSQWERVLVNASLVAGIEDWVKQLEVPDFPDNRITILFTSVCADLKKQELNAGIQNSLLRTDPALCALMLQLQNNDFAKRICKLKFIVETMEDVLSLLSDSTLEETFRQSLVDTLAAAIHDDSLGTLLQFSHARHLVVLSLSILLDNELKTHASEVLRAVMFSAPPGSGVPFPSNERVSMLWNIIDRCSVDELRWLEESLLVPYATESKTSSVSEIREAVTKHLQRKVAESGRQSETDGDGKLLEMRKETTAGQTSKKKHRKQRL